MVDVQSADAEHWVNGLFAGKPQPTEPAPLVAMPGPAGTTKIFPALIKVMQEVSHVAKDGRNLDQKYAFRGIDGVMNAIGPAVRKHGVLAVPHKIDLKYRDARTTKDNPTREVIAKIVYRFYAEDGSYVEAEVPGESLDQSDKGSAKAMSVALRIVWLQILTLPTQEPTTDHDGHYHTRGGEPRMSKFERDAGMTFLRVPLDGERAVAGAATMAAAFQQALDFRACLEEHAAWLTPSNGDESPTWEELFTARVAAEIEAADTGEHCNALWNTLKVIQLDMTHDGKPFTQLIKERAAAIKERNAKAMDTVTGQVLTADLDDLQLNGPVWLSIEGAYNLGRITAEQWTQLTDLAEERRRKLAAELNVATDAEHEAGFRAADEDGSAK